MLTKTSIDKGGMQAKIIIFVVIFLVSLGIVGWHIQNRVPTTVSEDSSLEMAYEYIRKSPTFEYDGIEDSLKHIETLYPEKIDTLEFIFSFECKHAGYGNRTGQILAQVITPHRAHIMIQDGEVISALIDDRWDIIKQEMVSDKKN